VVYPQCGTTCVANYRDRISVKIMKKLNLRGLEEIVGVGNYIIISITVYNILLILLLQLTEEAKNKSSSSRLKSDKKTRDAELRTATHKK
jgi:hypothetical protein